MSTMTDALFDDRNGTLIVIEVSPGAKSDLFPAGYNEWRKAIGCRVTAPAVDGRANKAVIGLISTTIGVPASAVSIVSGLTSSQKKVRIAGVTRAQLAGQICAGREKE
ncbi:MAG: DUF167 domain-containing protein [Methanoregula sp.]|jgi:hypothetical protein|uniref:DUF167 domain-containing protein n=1 Tax=Methanoregula sp. TaxID=2052170 RepID=UPI003D1003EF